jgi:hypothetical protein
VGLIENMTNWALVILTLGLVIVTFRYVRHTKTLADHTKRMADYTKRMADVMARDYEDKVAPLIEVEVRPASHHSRGFGIPCLVSNLGEYPVTAKKLVMEWWHRENPSQPRRVERALDKKLFKGAEPISVEMLLDDSAIENEEIPETLERKGYNLGTLVAASIWLEFLDKKDSPGQTPKRTLDPLT